MGADCAAAVQPKNLGEFLHLLEAEFPRGAKRDWLCAQVRQWLALTTQADCRDGSDLGGELPWPPCPTDSANVLEFCAILVAVHDVHFRGVRFIQTDNPVSSDGRPTYGPASSTADEFQLRKERTVWSLLSTAVEKPGVVPDCAVEQADPSGYLIELWSALQHVLREWAQQHKSIPSLDVRSSTAGPLTSEAIGLQPAHENAWRSYSFAKENHAGSLTDKIAYDWLKHWLEENDFTGTLIGYRLPSFDTWKRYVTGARKFYRCPKNLPRFGREASSRSIVGTDSL